MFEFGTLSDSMIVGAFIVLLVLVFLRFGDALVDLLVSYRSSPVEVIENSMPDQE